MDELLTLKQVAELEKTSRTTVWRRIKAGTLPAPVMVGDNSPRIIESEYLACRANLPRADYAPTEEANLPTANQVAAE